MTSSTSQIFTTAASFQLSQNVYFLYLKFFYYLNYIYVFFFKKDAEFYSRETMHLLAKFLSAHAKLNQNQINRENKLNNLVFIQFYFILDMLIFYILLMFDS